MTELGIGRLAIQDSHSWCHSAPQGQYSGYDPQNICAYTADGNCTTGPETDAATRAGSYAAFHIFPLPGSQRYTKVCWEKMGCLFNDICNTLFSVCVSGVYACAGACVCVSAHT